MTRLMLIADVHGDADALEAALRWSSKLHCTAIWCAGDLVDLGPEPARTVRLARDNGLICVRGNHDRWVTQRNGVCDIEGPRDDRGNGVRSTERLSADAVKWLHDLPLHVEATIESVSLAMWHAWPKASDMEFLFHDLPAWALLSASERAEAQVLIVGHTHAAFRIVCPNGRCIINPGSLLRRGPPAEMTLQTKSIHGVFGILELPGRRFSVHSIRDGEPVEIQERVLY